MSQNNDSQANAQSKPATIVNCPTCNAEVEWLQSSEFRPFCSKRCQLIDLGEWADENHKIKGKSGFSDMPIDIEDIEEMLHESDSFFKE
ncbi:MAG: endogenous inhibitor of DNA gyrase (YacG/DUF329 family) [Alteromonadaceae bacterium]|jgi:endogenous inhibitor of DNA gyrase (YacG/DUF329 family)